MIPTPVDVSRYSATGDRKGNRLVWIGQPGNLNYLSLIRPSLEELSREMPELTLRVICNRFPDWPEIRIERKPWSKGSESRLLAASDIGLMPLPDDAWAAGKGAFKLLQYMASSLPCVASPVGMNRLVVREGSTGYLASGRRAWRDSLGVLLRSPEKREAMGRLGRRRVEQTFDLRVLAPEVATLYEMVADGPREAA